ncbi:MAG: flavin reductase family protein [Acidimicrobiales bacterium]
MSSSDTAATRPPADDGAHFRKVLGHFPTGVTVVTAVSDGKPVGLAIGSFFSVSLDPPLVAFCPANTSSSWPAIEKAGAFCVNVMGKDQLDVCKVFASKEPDKFANIQWTPGATGSPVIRGSLAWMDCTIKSVYAEGDHFIVVGLVQELDVEGDSEGPLLFYQGRYGNFTG